MQIALCIGGLFLVLPIHEFFFLLRRIVRVFNELMIVDCSFKHLFQMRLNSTFNCAKK